MRKTWLSWKTALTWWLSSRGGIEIVTEGLLDDHGDAAFFGLRHALRAQVLNDAGEELGRGGEIEEAVVADALLFSDAVELGLQVGVVRGIVEVEGEVADVADKAVELGVGGFDAAKLDDAGAHVGGKLVAQRAARDADDSELPGRRFA